MISYLRGSITRWPAGGAVDIECLLINWPLNYHSATVNNRTNQLEFQFVTNATPSLALASAVARGCVVMSFLFQLALLTSRFETMHAR